MQNAKVHAKRRMQKTTVVRGLAWMRTNAGRHSQEGSQKILEND
jgi:hypothetical protein